MGEAAALVEADGAGIVGVDEQRDALGRAALGFVDQKGCELRTPMRRGNHELIEIACRVDGHEACKLARSLGADDRRPGYQLATPALAPPRNPRGEIDSRIGLLPARLPQRDRGVFV